MFLYSWLNHIRTSLSMFSVPDHPPIANAGPDVEVTLPTSSVELDGSGSTDDHGIVLYRWESVTPLDASVILEGTNNAVLRIKNLVDGVYRFRLTVTDKLGQTSEDTALVNVKPGILNWVILKIDFLKIFQSYFTQ